MKDVIIHAGLLNTGSTSIQHSLFYNQNVLGRNGYKYLEITKPDKRKLKNHSSAILNLFENHAKSHYLNKKNNWDADNVIKHYKKQLDAAIEERNGGKLLISGEGISSMSEDGLRNLREYFKGFNVRIIIFIRDPYESLCSRIQEAISKGSRFKISELKPGHSKVLESSRIIGTFQKAFPETRRLCGKRKTLRGHMNL